ncbi:MAG: hypothetical protein KJ062_06000 [Thermoanaerobaculia bacterium]|nr:hypothetical protein [Thermoanaerobaculia bacterium]
MDFSELPPEVLALDDLVLGRGVKRGRHALPPGFDVLLKERLAALGFTETTVGAVEIDVGVRVPAWLVGPSVADFGTVFWEVFTDRARRKLFGSEVRNVKGDWEIQLSPSSGRQIWAGLHLAEAYDASRPVGMF